MLLLEARYHAELLETRVSERTAELHRSHQQLERSRQQQLELNDQFLANVSHEVRAPFAVAHLFVRNLLDGVSGDLAPQQRDDMEVVFRNVDPSSAHVRRRHTSPRRRLGHWVTSRSRSMSTGCGPPWRTLSTSSPPA